MSAARTAAEVDVQRQAGQIGARRRPGIGGALTEGVASMDLDAGMASQLGLGDVAADLAAFSGPLDQWILRGGIDFRHWEHRLVEAGIWMPRPRSLVRPFPRYDDVHAARTADDRSRGVCLWPEEDGSAQLPAVLALGQVGRLFGQPDPVFSLNHPPN